MIKRRSLTLFVVAIGLGIAATWMANQWIKNRLTPVAQTQPDMATVVVAALEIPFGQKIEAAQLKTMEWPNGNVPPGAFNDPAKVEGKIANGKIFPNEVILGDRVADQVSGSTLAAVIGPKKRAVTVRVNDVIGVAGFLLPGNRVDVIAARKSGNNRRSITRTILQNLKVLAVDQTAAPEKDKPVVVRAVTLEMDPKQAEVLIKATDEGSVQLSLRNPTDESQLVAAAKKPAEQKVHVAPTIAPKSYARHVTVIRGTQVQKTQVRL